MAISNLVKGYESQGQSTALGPPLAFFAAILTTAAAAGTAVRTLPGEFVLPLISTVLFVFAAVTAMAGWRRRRSPASLTYWDVAGALTFIGICAAALIEPDQLVRVMGSSRLP